MQLPVQLRKRNQKAHKGEFGHVLIVGGSPGLTGAICLCATSCIRSGCGLVTVGVPKSLNPIIEIKLTEAMSLALNENAQKTLSVSAYNTIKTFSKKTHAFALGCGASQNGSTKKLLQRLVQRIGQPLVVDADGINALAENVGLLLKRKAATVVLTPHVGEFSRLIKKHKDYIKKHRKELAKQFALRYNLILVLKGHHTIVTDGKRIFENTTGNSGLATAGSGDVLTGTIASFLAQGVSGFAAAKSAVYMHGLSADYAAKDKTQNALIASDIIEYLPVVFKKLIHK